MIVVIFVIQNNFKTVQEFPTVCLDFTTDYNAHRSVMGGGGGGGLGGSPYRPK